MPALLTGWEAAAAAAANDDACPSAANGGRGNATPALPRRWAGNHFSGCTEYPQLIDNLLNCVCSLQRAWNSGEKANGAPCSPPLFWNNKQNFLSQLDRMLQAPGSHEQARTLKKGLSALCFQLFFWLLGGQRRQRSHTRLACLNCRVMACLCYCHLEPEVKRGQGTSTKRALESPKQHKNAPASSQTTGRWQLEGSEVIGI